MTAFSRATAMHAAIRAAVEGLTAPSDIQAVLSRFNYRSRGHGGKFPNRHANAHKFHPSKYTPHQGNQECARRVAHG